MKFILKYQSFNYLVRGFTCLFLLNMLGVFSVYSQQLSKDELGKIMNKIPNLIRENFVVPEIATKTADGIENNFKSGKYDEVSTYDELIKTVTKDLQTLSDDLHLYLRKVETSKKSQRGSSRVRRMNPGGRGSRSFDRFKNSEGKIISYKKLGKNVLYINVAVFAPLEIIKNELKEALNESKKADAIIIDLRKCPGGAGDSMEYLAGGFLEKETLLSKHFQKDGGFESRSTKTPYGKINNTKPLYVLTSEKSFSAAEAFAFFMQEIGRVTVVGVQTRGGGRTTRMYPVNDLLNISISDSIAVSSKGNQFQGVGVKPDIPTSENKALDTAHKEIVKYVVSQNIVKKLH